MVHIPPRDPHAELKRMVAREIKPAWPEQAALIERAHRAYAARITSSADGKGDMQIEVVMAFRANAASPCPAALPVWSFSDDTHHPR